MYTCIKVVIGQYPASNLYFEPSLPVFYPYTPKYLVCIEAGGYAALMPVCGRQVQQGQADMLKPDVESKYMEN